MKLLHWEITAKENTDPRLEINFSVFGVLLPLLTLTALEIIAGTDNMIFIPVVWGKHRWFGFLNGMGVTPTAETFTGTATKALFLQPLPSAWLLH